MFLALIEQPLLRRRAEAAACRPLTAGEVRCLAALVFLHDVGKLAPGFQAKGWADAGGLRLRGHLECGWIWTWGARPDALAGAVAHIATWPALRDWFTALFAHHGRPVADPGRGTAANAFRNVAYYDWTTEETVLGQALLSWFPEIRTQAPPPPTPGFLHFFCGLLTLADWIGSDRGAFPFEADFRPDYWRTADARAARRLHDIGLLAGPILAGAPGWTAVSDHPEPRPAQRAVGDLPASDHLVLLEAETGSGKTEAALWRFATLRAADEVDALYFAVPTRAAARQLHRRVNAAMKRMFDPAPEAVLAIPGQVMAGEARGHRLPDFAMLWDDSEDKPARWAAEHSARFLAAQVAIGTVDQMALGGLQVKYAHLRGASLSRALLVIDEVHASDPYMTEVQSAMVRAHLDLGGHALLMSATLGAVARRRWFGDPPAPFASDVAVPYPAVWTERGMRAVQPDGTGKRVRVSANAGWTGEDAAALAIDAAHRGGRVLVIRNTVDRARETFFACRDAVPDLLLTVEGVPTLHHGRFAVEDRARLDLAVENAIGKDSPMGGRIVVGTQTLEQSLDLCADVLITDLCPIDVLLQRIGRLHRHRRPRPEHFAEAVAVVLCPPGGLEPLIVRQENGLGANASGPDLSGIYVDVPGLAATMAEIEARPVWEIPAMNRALVEAATHPEVLDRIADLRGWRDYRQRVVGKVLADMRTAGLAILDRSRPLECFPDDERLRTRLGEEGAVLALPEGTLGAFGLPVGRIALPAHWSRGLTGDEGVAVEAGPPTVLTIGERRMTYGPDGLMLLGVGRCDV